MTDPDPDEQVLRERSVDEVSAEHTGVLPVTRQGLADFLEGEPVLPVAVLLVVSGSARGTVLVVDELPAVIGRSAEADLVIDDDTVSRRHAVLHGDRSALEVEDLGSSNGTTLQGNPIAGSLSLLDGDLAGFGSAMVLVKRFV